MKDRHWYCDAIAIHFRSCTIDLCEISYSKTLHSLYRRLQAWSDNWPQLTAAIVRDSSLKDLKSSPSKWRIQPHIFVHTKNHSDVEGKLKGIARQAGQSEQMPDPQITWLEDVLPWTYRAWNGTRYEENAEAKHHTE